MGVVSFLNSRPLIDGLDADRGVSLHYDVPSALPGLLRRGEVDASLIPVIDLARSGGAWEPVSDACISSEGETMTVRVFSKVPPDEMRVLYVDPDSHTSVALAYLVWLHHYERRLELRPLTDMPAEACDSVLLIGDKVVTTPLMEHTYDIDLGGAWRALTGLPFVFAVWAAPARQARPELAGVLSAARDRGVSRAREIAREFAPARGWPRELAEDYLTRTLSFMLTARHREGMRRFMELAAREGIAGPVPQPAV